MVGRRNARRVTAWTSLLLLGCGSSHHTDENGDAGNGDSGTDAAIGLECSDLVDEAPGITPGCPTNTVCPTAPECQSCDTCADPTGLGAPLVDGLYELRSAVAYISS